MERDTWREVAERMELESCLRGLYRLLAYVQDGPDSGTSAHVRAARIHELRSLQARLVENLPAFLNAGTSAAEAAVRADVMDALARTSLRFTGRSFESFAQPEPVDERSAALGMPESALTSQGLRRWLGALVASGQIAGAHVIRTVERWTLQLLPLLDPAERGPILQQLYDGGLIFNLAPRLSLSGAYFSRADLSEAMLARAQLAGANLRGSRLVGANLNQATLRQASLITAQLGCVLLRGADLQEAEIAGASLLGADLCEANLSGANLVKAMLRKATLTGATLVEANLLGSHLEEAVLAGADLRNANLLWANLSGATLDGVQLSGALYNAHTHWPQGFIPEAHSMVVID